MGGTLAHEDEVAVRHRQGFVEAAVRRVEPLESEPASSCIRK